MKLVNQDQFFFFFLSLKCGQTNNFLLPLLVIDDFLSHLSNSRTKILLQEDFASKLKVQKLRDRDKGKVD